MVQSAVGNRVTVLGRDGAALRVALPFAPASQLAGAALDALRAVLPAELWWALYGQWLAASGEGGWGAGRQADCCPRALCCCVRILLAWWGGVHSRASNV